MTTIVDGAGYDGLALETHDGVATLWLNRPELRNAFDERLIAGITAAVQRVADDPAARVLVVAARGPAFCAGADLNWMRRMAGFSPAENHADALTLARMLRALHTCPKPTIARVHGDCYAGGLGLVAACDLAVAATGVQFCLTEVRIGLIPATIGPYVLRAMGPRAASRYMLTAERFDATQAARLGLVHTVVDAADLDAEVARFAQALVAGGPEALAATKQLIDTLAEHPIDTALIEDTAGRIASRRASAEGREGVQAVLGKRRPVWNAEREP